MRSEGTMQFRRYSRPAVSLLLALALCALLATPGEPDAPEALPASDSPLGALTRLLVSYRLERLDDYAALLLPRFQFEFGDSELRAAHPNGFSREEEITSARHLFQGFTDESGVQRPAARAISTSFDTVCASDEPGRADSAAQYQVLVACGLRLQIELEDGTGLDVGPACHEFHFVRGDVAACGAEQPRDADHWYLWRWVESSSCESVAAAAALATRAPPVPEARGVPGPRAAAARVDLGSPQILRVPNPAHGAVGVWMRLPDRRPARLIMFDVAGRSVLEQELGVPISTESRFELSGAARLPAGLYWLRIAQGDRVGRAHAVVLQ
jgi:hypothetical protein